MKKSIIGAIVGGLLIFIWQTLSWTVLELHRPAQDYTSKQDTILQLLNGTLEEGGYYMPSVPKGTSMEETIKVSEAMQGKPWATIQYHKSMSMDDKQMYANMGRGLIVNILMVWLLCWIIGKSQHNSFGSVFLASLFTGLIVYINSPYTSHIWYHLFDIRAHLWDALVSWGVCGLWLGWWLNRKS